MITKTCSVCGEVKPLEEFPIYKTVGEVDYRRTKCDPCYKNYFVEYNAKQENKEARQAQYVEKNWGIPHLTYKLLMEGGCEVCGTTEKLVLDHDHDCCPGKYGCEYCIRGALCSRHNLAEGNLHSNEEEAYALYLYMKRVNKNRKGLKYRANE